MICAAFVPVSACPTSSGLFEGPGERRPDELARVTEKYRRDTHADAVTAKIQWDSDMSTVAKAGHAKGIAQEYFSAWKRGDFDRVRSLLADDATFRGPLASVNGAEKISRGLTYQRNS